MSSLAYRTIAALQINSNDITSRLFKQFERFNSAIIDIDLQANQVNEIDMASIIIEKFVGHVFQTGNIGEKRALIGCLDKDYYLKDRQLCTN